MISTEKFKKKLYKIKKRGERQKVKYELESRYAQYYPHKKRKVSNVMLVVIVCAIMAYTLSNIWVTYKTGVSIDSTLTTCFYAFWTVEILSLAGIRISKSRKESNVEETFMSEDEGRTYEEEV